MKCTQCDMNIPSHAKICPYCRSEVTLSLTDLLLAPFMLMFGLPLMIILIPVQVFLYAFRFVIFIGGIIFKIITLPFTLIGKIFS